MIERITRTRSSAPISERPGRRDPRAREAGSRSEIPSDVIVVSAEGKPLRVNVHAEAKFRLRREVREKAAEPSPLATAARPDRLDPRARRSNRTRPEVLQRDSNLAAGRTDPAGTEIRGEVLRLDTPAAYVFAVSTGGEAWSGGEREMLGGARQIADKIEGAAVMLLRIGVAQADCDAGKAGADRLWQHGENDISSETATACILAAISRFSPRHIIFADGNASGDIARRVATELGERPAVGLQKMGDNTVVSRGNGGRSDFTRPMPRILLATSGLFDPVENAMPREARLLEMASDVPVLVIGRVRDLGPETMSVSNVPLPEADFIVSAGDGITDWPGFMDVADALSGVIGGSRQVCDAGHLPRHRQVGASGTLVEAKVYLALGISGAPQHLQGIQRCRFVAAVNTDLHAAMIKRADLAIIADAQEVMPALASLAREKRHGR